MPSYKTPQISKTLCGCYLRLDEPTLGHLASIRDVYEQNFVYSIFFEYSQGDHLSRQDMCYIGLSDNKVSR